MPHPKWTKYPEWQELINSLPEDKRKRGKELLMYAFIEGLAAGVCSLGVIKDDAKLALFISALTLPFFEESTIPPPPIHDVPIEELMEAGLTKEEAEWMKTGGVVIPFVPAPKKGA